MLQQAAGRSFDHASHFQNFSTLLFAMGYDLAWAERRFGPSLLSTPLPQERRFLTGIFFSSGAKWLTIGPHEMTVLK